MKRNAIVIAVVAVAVALMLFASVHMARKRAGIVKLKPVGKNGSVAPDFELKSIDGKQGSLARLRVQLAELRRYADRVRVGRS